MTHQKNVPMVLLIMRYAPTPLLRGCARMITQEL